jgi:2,3-dihydroxyethylbenzene 1,2-dioxygenase
MANVTQLGYLGIGVSDINAWEKFATQTLGLQVSEREEDGTLLLRMDEYRYRFALHPDGADDVQDVQYVGWEVADEHALSVVAKRVRKAGTNVKVGKAAE